MGKIAILHEQLANQIAAGEVVERPASVVKELVENSIDANSTVIKIEVEEGGLQAIKVTDNGDGIASEDCLLAFERHATSKIRHERDLFSIRSLGFRGEALPSIASVSRTEIKTCTGDGPGTHLVIEAGEVKHHSVAPSRKGTEVTVTRLFFNTPARLKHLKSVHTELGNISDVVNRLAMAHPEISFQLFHNGKQLLKTDGKNNLLQVISSAYGVSVAKNMVSLHGQSLDFTITGYTTKPTETRASRKYASLFINGRYIRNYKLVNAIIEGYHTFLPVGRYPISVVHIQMDPTLVDINVHPAKLEARLSKEDELIELVKTTIQQALQKTDVIPEIKTEKQTKTKPKQTAFSFHFQPKRDEKKALEHLWGDEFQGNASAGIEREEKPLYPNRIEEPKAIEAIDGHSDREQAERKQDENTANEFPELYPIGQVHGTYIVAQNDEGLYLIDQHAAQERIKYEYYYDKFKEAPNDLQDLLIPITFELTVSEQQIVEEHRELFESFGIHFEPFGEKTYIVRSHPTWFPKGEEAETIRNIVDLLLEEKTFDLQKLREETAIMLACKRSIKANQFLTQDEMAALLQTLKTCRSPYTCPHGRPIMVHFSTYELKKMFKRVM